MPVWILIPPLEAFRFQSVRPCVRYLIPKVCEHILQNNDLREFHQICNLVACSWDKDKLITS